MRKCGFSLKEKGSDEFGDFLIYQIEHYPDLSLDLELQKYDPSLHSHLIPELTKMLNESYSPLARKGLKYLASHQDDETTIRRLDRGPSYLGFINGELISTITLVLNTPTTVCKWYRPTDHCFFTQFAVRESFKGQGIGNQLMDFVEKKAIESGAKEIALDTSEKADQLIRFYKKRNYRFVQYVDWEVTNYRSLVMSKNLASGIKNTGLY